jgi:hypothetical protein
MKLIFLMLMAFTWNAAAEEFRFKCIESTGLCDSVYDAHGKETTIIIADDSDRECLALFKALQQKRVYGTQGVEEDVRGVKWDQAIILTGEFTSGIKRTKSGPNTAPSEEYRDFKITSLKIRFPLSRFVEISEGNVIDGPIIMETHFGFDSLFPGGVKFNGKLIDLSKHVDVRPDAN